MTDTTFCIWRGPSDSCWQTGRVSYPPGADPDGSEALLSPLDGHPETYRTWAEHYYEKQVTLEPAIQIYQHSPLSQPLLTELGCTRTLDEVLGEASEIAYPVGVGLT
jgi:hypothetical protein